MLTGSMVLMWTLGAEDERSRWPNWLRWSSSLGRKLGGIGMDLDGDTVLWHIDLERAGVRFESTFTCKRLRRPRARPHPVESDGGSDGQASDTGVVPSEDTSSWVNGWCSKNLDTNSKLWGAHRWGSLSFSGPADTSP